MSNEVLWVSGLFNYTDPILGWQFYIWIWIGLLILAGICWLIWRYGMWEPYKPLWGLFHAYKAESNAGFIFNMGLVSELISERAAKCIFDYSKWKYEFSEESGSIIKKYTGFSKVTGWIKRRLFNYATVFLDNIDFLHGLLYKYGGKNFDVEIAKKLQNYDWESTSSVTSGGIHCDMILDADRWSVRTSPQHQVVERVAEQWNDANPDDQVHSYPKFQRMLLNKVIDCPPGIQPTVTVPWVRIDQAFPLNMANNEASGPVREMAIEMENEDATAVSRYYLPVLFACMGFAILEILVRIVMKMMFK